MPVDLNATTINNVTSRNLIIEQGVRTDQGWNMAYRGERVWFKHHRGSDVATIGSIETTTPTIAVQAATDSGLTYLEGKSMNSEGALSE